MVKLLPCLSGDEKTRSVGSSTEHRMGLVSESLQPKGSEVRRHLARIIDSDV